MFADADHEVIDSPEALLRHLYEEHGVEEARDLDPDTAPVQFWVRRHTELERAQRAARRDPDPTPEPQDQPQPEARPDPELRPHRGARPPEAPSQPASRPQPERRPQPEPRSRPGTGRRPAGQGVGTAGRDGRRPAGFGDPLVEALARALAGRGHDQGAVRAAIRSFAGVAGAPAGEAAVRAAFVEPMLQSVAERLLGAAGSRRPGRPQPAAAVTPQPANASAGTDPSPAPAVAPPARPEAAWAVLWADLAETARRTPGEHDEAGDGDDLMAVADAVQQRRRVRVLRR